MSMVPIGGNDDTYSVGVNVDLAGALPQFNQFNMLVNQTNSQFNQLNNTLKLSQSGAGGVFGSLSSIVGTAAGIGLLVRTVRELTAAFAEANKEANKLGSDTSKWQQSLQELQSMSGKPEALGADVQRENLGLIRQGLTQPQALKFQQTFGGEAAEAMTPDAAGKRRVTPQAYAQTQAKLAQLAVSMGGDPSEFAKLGGRFLAMYGDKMSPDQILSLTANTFRTIGFAPGATTQMLPQFTNALTSNVFAGPGGNVDTPQKLAAMVFGVGTGTSVGRAGTATDQVSNAMLGLTRGSSEFKTWADQLPGAKKGMDAYDKMVMIARQARKDLGLDEKQLAELAKDVDEKGEGEESEGQMRVAEYLGSKGLKMAAPRRGLAAIIANLPRIERVYGMKQMDVGEINKGMEAAMQTPAMQQKLAQGALTAETLEEGQRYQMMSALMTRAQASLKRQGIDTPEIRSAEAMGDLLAGRSVTGLPGEQQQKLYTQLTKEAVGRYGNLFQFGGPDNVISQGEISAGMKDFSLNEAINEAENRFQRNNFRRGADVGTQVEAPTEGGVLSDLPGPAEVGRRAVSAAGNLIPYLKRIADNTESPLPLPQNAPEPKR
jgi:hypothetical protein